MDVRIQPDRLAETFAALVAIDSPSYGERQMADELTRRLRALGLTVEEDDAAERIGGTSGNLYGFLPGTLDLPPLLLCAHMDTVAPANGKRAVRESDGRIHSAGDTVLGADDLAAVAIILEVLEALAESGAPTGRWRCCSPPRRRPTVWAPPPLTFPGSGPVRPMCWTTRGRWGRR